MLDGSIKTAIQDLLRWAGLDLRRQYAFPVKARVLKVYPAANQYVCDVLPLRNNGEEIRVTDGAGVTKKVQPIVRVPICTRTNGPNRGLFGLPAKGELVIVSFLGGDWSWPVVTGALGRVTPGLDEGEVGLYLSAETFLRLRPEGQVILQQDPDTSVSLTGAEIRVKTGSKVVVESPEVHLAGETGKEVARKGDKVVVDGKTGTIIEGSTKVKAE